jgi:hypothetical protein
MAKPDFIIIGAAKSGTTSLARYLDAHSEVQIIGERLEFFGEYGNPRFGDMEAEQYKALMSNEDYEDKKVGEKSVSYLYAKSAPREIAELCPDAKLIVVLRDPSDRAYSDYWHRVRTGVEPLSFKDALDAEARRIVDGARFELHYTNYGRYADHLSRYIKQFGRDQLLVLFYEDLQSDPTKATQQCFDFIGINAPAETQSFEVHNAGGNKTSGLVRAGLRLAQNKTIVTVLRRMLPKALTNMMGAYLVKKTSAGKYPDMNTEDRARLVSFFADDITDLEELTGRDLTDWRKV